MYCSNCGKVGCMYGSKLDPLVAYLANTIEEQQVYLDHYTCTGTKLQHQMDLIENRATRHGDRTPVTNVVEVPMTKADITTQILYNRNLDYPGYVELCYRHALIDNPNLTFEDFLFNPSEAYEMNPSNTGKIESIQGTEPVKQYITFEDYQYRNPNTTVMDYVTYIAKLINSTEAIVDPLGLTKLGAAGFDPIACTKQQLTETEVTLDTKLIDIKGRKQGIQLYDLLVKKCSGGALLTFDVIKVMKGSCPTTLVGDLVHVINSYDRSTEQELDFISRYDILASQVINYCVSRGIQEVCLTETLVHTGLQGPTGQINTVGGVKHIFDVVVGDELLLVTDGMAERIRTGAFEAWLAANPNGTYDQFMRLFDLASKSIELKPNDPYPVYFPEMEDRSSDLKQLRKEILAEMDTWYEHTLPEPFSRNPFDHERIKLLKDQYRAIRKFIKGELKEIITSVDLVHGIQCDKTELNSFGIIGKDADNTNEYFRPFTVSFTNDNFVVTTHYE